MDFLACTGLADHGVQPSMSRVGNPYDNAKAESFMKTLKEEQVRGQQWRDLNALRTDSDERFYRSPTTTSGCIPRWAIKLRPPSNSSSPLNRDRGFYKAEWGEGADRPLAPHPTPRLQSPQQHKLSPVSLSHAKGAVHPSVPAFPPAFPFASKGWASPRLGYPYFFFAIKKATSKAIANALRAAVPVDSGSCRIPG